MNSSELAHWCVSVGFLPPSLEASASQSIGKAYEKKGEEEVERHLRKRAKGSPIKSIRVLEMVLSDLPDKAPEPDPKEEMAREIAEEIELEHQDYEQILRENDEFAKTWKRLFPDENPNRGFTEPNDPRFDEHPSVFDGPYLDHPEYKANTYISVKREADAEGTSMHEICRRKNLIYEALIQ